MLFAGFCLFSPFNDDDDDDGHFETMRLEVSNSNDDCERNMYRKSYIIGLYSGYVQRGETRNYNGKSLFQIVMWYE